MVDREEPAPSQWLLVASSELNTWATLLTASSNLGTILPDPTVGPGPLSDLLDVVLFVKVMAAVPSDLAMAIAVPVRPDQLAANIEAYDISLPRLYTLRLCQRSGRCPGVRITKLPAELLLEIEEYIVASHRSDDWKETFRHFQRLCQPRHHIEGSEQRFRPFSCFYCRVDRPEPCPECINLKYHDLNELIDGSMQDHVRFQCQYEQDMWKFLGRSGARWLLQKVLPPHFGLEAVFVHTRKSPERWSDHNDHNWHSASDLYTTVRYLALPYQGKRLLTSLSQGEANVSKSSFVVFPTTGTTQDITTTFRRALHTLSIQPREPPARLNDAFSAAFGRGKALLK